MKRLFYIDEAEERGWLPLSPAPQSPLGSSVASLRTIALDDSEHLLHNHHASVASLRLLFSFLPERRSASLRKQRSPSPEYPLNLDISTYPQVEVNNTKNSVRRGLADDGPLFLLPLEVTKKVGPINVDLEVGRWFTQQKDYWIGGLALGHQATKRLEVLAEVYNDSDPQGQRDNTFDFGGRYRLNRNALSSSWPDAASILPAAGNRSSSDTSGCSSSSAAICATMRNGSHLYF